MNENRIEKYRNFRSYYPTRLLIAERKRLGRLLKQVSDESDRKRVEKAIEEFTEVIEMLKVKFDIKEEE